MNKILNNVIQWTTKLPQKENQTKYKKIWALLWAMGIYISFDAERERERVKNFTSFLIGVWDIFVIFGVYAKCSVLFSFLYDYSF